ncbi:MAG: aldo/keto reductase [Planctomycetota bacterium]|nr:aldo/keto reductase [Planctomycetota bacterium]
MKTRRLGHTDLDITLLGFGAWAIGGSGWAFGWGSQDDRESIAAIREAIDLGINWIDTAAIYGLGHSEEVVAAALEGVQNRPYVFTKCERVWNERGEIGKSLKADSIRRECEASLKRLRVDVIDLYQIHWPEPAEDVEEGWETLNRLKTEGKVRWIGVSNFDAAQLARASTIAPVASLQPPYSMLRRDIEESIFPYCLAHGIGTIVYSPMQSGLLTGSWSQERMAALPADDWRKEKNRHFQPPLFERNLQLVEVLRTIAARHGATPGQVAIAWTLRHPAVTAAIVGARKPGQLRDLLPAATLTLTATDLAAIDDFLKAHPES